GGKIMGNYYLGLDVGIGSIGWAVINIEKKRIEDFNVRIFKSGEIQEKNRNSRASQQCRRSRGLRDYIDEKVIENCV
ncbi:hypothetical protein, partial [Ruminococcus albus]|uniref:hypothetical protein n=1 Tax=Ruminococcus albus TaxID=1264 RepID=UPI001D14875E